MHTVITPLFSVEVENIVHIKTRSFQFLNGSYLSIKGYMMVASSIKTSVTVSGSFTSHLRVEGRRAPLKTFLQTAPPKNKTSNFVSSSCWQFSSGSNRYIP